MCVALGISEGSRDASGDLRRYWGVPKDLNGAAGDIRYSFIAVFEGISRASK